MAKKIKQTQAVKDQQKIMKEASKIFKSPENIKGYKQVPIHKKPWQKVFAETQEYYGKAHNFGAAGKSGKSGKSGKKAAKPATGKVIGIL